MSKIFITGSSDGLGQFTAKSLIELGHDVVLHARNSKRADDAMKNNPGAEAVLIADLSKMDEAVRLAEEVNKLGPFDVIIHNAGVYEASGEEIFSVNTLAPFVLTSLIEKPKRIIYISSGMHLHGHFKPESFNSGNVSYSDSKLHVLMLSMAVAGKWKNVFSNSVNPGWVPTKMGGSGAPDNLQKGYETQVWLANSMDDKALVSGKYFFHQKVIQHNIEVDDVMKQETFLSLCNELTGMSLP